jgi:thermostable 8-oxoguanine DNA glycosylase
MLLSYVNTQLRDFYPSVEEFCAALAIPREELDQALDGIDYRYDREKNQYI